MFKKYDRVFSIISGWGDVIDDMDEQSEHYPIRVLFDNTAKDTFTTEGRYEKTDLIPTLYHGEPIIIAPPEPQRRPALNINDRIQIKNSNNGTWYNMYFCMWVDNNIVVFADGCTSWSSPDHALVRARYWRVPDD